MFCPKCGQPNPDTSQFCFACAQALPSLPASPPVGVATAATSPAAPPETDKKAIASLICGLLSFIFPAAIAAIILGHISRSDIRKSGGRLTGAGMALTGLIFGYLGASITPFLILAAIAIPNLLRARIAANEASAVASIRTINNAEVAYIEAHPGAGYTCALSELNGPSASIGDLIRGEKRGYVFSVETCTPKSYAIVAMPQVKDQSGKRAFCAKEDYVIRYDPTGSEEDCLAHGQELQ